TRRQRDSQRRASVVVDAPPHPAGDGHCYLCVRSLASRRLETAMTTSTSGASAKTTVAAAKREAELLDPGIRRIRARGPGESSRLRGPRRSGYARCARQSDGL